MQPPCRAWALADVERNRRHCRRRRRRRRARDGCSGRTGRIDRAFLYPPATRLLDRSKRVPPCERVQNTFPSENAGREKRKDNLSMKKKAHARAQARQKKTVTHGCAPGPEAAGSSDRLGDEAGRPPEPEDQDPRHPRPHLVSHTPLSLHGCTAEARSWLLASPPRASNRVRRRPRRILESSSSSSTPTTSPSFTTRIPVATCARTTPLQAFACLRPTRSDPARVIDRPLSPHAHSFFPSPPPRDLRFSARPATTTFINAAAPSNPSVHTHHTSNSNPTHLCPRRVQLPLRLLTLSCQ
jgi:hypothetical protein